MAKQLDTWWSNVVFFPFFIHKKDSGIALREWLENIVGAVLFRQTLLINGLDSW